MANKCKQCGKETKNKVFCNNRCKGDWQREQKPYTKEWLYQKYVVDGMSANAIAEIVKRDPKSVLEWLKGYGIETRPRGHNYQTNPDFCFWESGKDNPSKGKKHTPESIAKMSESSKGPSPWLRGEVNHWYGKRGPLSRTWKGGVTPERQAFYGTIEWRRVAEQVWDRDKSTCQHCGKCKSDHPKIRLDIHHIVGFDDSKELRACLDNLVLLCHSCHMWVHSKNNTDKKFIKEIKSNE